jgi:hypothetical protein
MNPHLQQAHCQLAIFRSHEWDRVAQVAFRAKMAFQAEMVFRAEMASDVVSDVCVGLVEEHPYLCASSMSGDFSLCHFGTEDSRLIGSEES